MNENTHPRPIPVYMLGWCESSLKHDVNGNRIANWSVSWPDGTIYEQSTRRSQKGGSSHWHSREMRQAANALGRWDTGEVGRIRLNHGPYIEGTFTLYCRLGDAKKAINAYYGDQVKELDQERRWALDCIRE